MDKSTEKEVRHGSTEYWYNYLRNYMETYHFPIDENTIEDIKSKAESAAKVYATEQRNGNPCGASELALQTLFSSIGDSEHEVIVNILEDVPDFNQVIDVSDTRQTDFWVHTLSEIPGIFDKCRREWGYGLDPERVEYYYNSIVETIRNFLIENGFLQPTENSE